MIISDDDYRQNNSARQRNQMLPYERLESNLAYGGGHFQPVPGILVGRSLFH